MIGAGHRFAYRGVLVGVLAMLAVACAGAPAPTPKAAAPKSIGKPEKASLKIGLPGIAAHFLPIYLAAERTFEEEGLTVELVNLNGEAGTTQALAADSVDIGLATPTGLVNMIKAEQQVKGVYHGFQQVGLEWLARPEIKSWAELKGGSVAILAYGGLTDVLTRHALRKRGLEPERDVQIVQTGGGANSFPALKAGKVDAAFLPPPFTWQAEAEGFTRLGSVATEVAEEWPGAMFVARERFLEEYPASVRALLRAHVRAIRLAKADREAAVQALAKVLKYDRQYLDRAYDEVIAVMDEGGALPARGMAVFWDIAVATAEVPEPWPESRLFDRRFVDRFDEWAPS